jgi:hypothetical protein
MPTTPHHRPSTSIHLAIDPWIDAEKRLPIWRLRIVAGITGTVGRSHIQYFPHSTHPATILDAAFAFISGTLGIAISEIQFQLPYEQRCTQAIAADVSTPAGE